MNAIDQIEHAENTAESILCSGAATFNEEQLAAALQSVCRVLREILGVER